MTETIETILAIAIEDRVELRLVAIRRGQTKIDVGKPRVYVEKVLFEDARDIPENVDYAAAVVSLVKALFDAMLKMLGKQRPPIALRPYLVL